MESALTARSDAARPFGGGFAAILASLLRHYVIPAKASLSGGRYYHLRSDAQ
jgi:hypothetical protein